MTTIPELTSQTIAIGLSIAVVVSLVAILNVVREQSQSSLAQAMAENICHQVKLAAEQLSSSSQPSAIQLTLPSKIGNVPYSIRAINHTITVSSSSTSRSCIAGTQAQLSGTAFGTIRLTLLENKIELSSA